MRKPAYTIALLLGLLVNPAAQAQNEQINLYVPNFVRPLVEKWVIEYQKTNTKVDIQFISGKSQNTDNNILFTTDDDAIVFARFAVFPVTAKASKAQQLIGSHRLNSKKLKNLFFIKDDYDEDEDSDKESAIHIYTGSSHQSVSHFFAKHFRQEDATFKGKKISGDDSFLNTAISRDTWGITVNLISNIFDLQSRRVREGLALLPLDIDKQGKQVLNEGRLDEIITLLENQSYGEIPVGKVGLAYNQSNPVLNDFVHWIMIYGTQYIHEFGLLELPKKDLAQK